MARNKAAAVIILLMGLTISSAAWARGGGGGGGHGGGGWHGGGHFHGHGGWHGGGRFRGSVGVFFGAPLYWPYYYPYYYPSVAVVPASPPVYIEQQSASPQPGYWYYCSDPQGYYPNVGRCNVPWQKVAPQPPP